MNAVTAVEDEVRELVRRRGLDPVADPSAVRRLVDEVISDYDERSLAGSLPQLVDAPLAARQVFDAVAGFGPLQKFLDDPTVEEIWVNLPGRRGDRLMGGHAHAGVAPVGQPILDVRQRDSRLPLPQIREPRTRRTARRLSQPLGWRCPYPSMRMISPTTHMAGTRWPVAGVGCLAAQEVPLATPSSSRWPPHVEGVDPEVLPVSRRRWRWPRRSRSNPLQWLVGKRRVVIAWGAQALVGEPKIEQHADLASGVGSPFDQAVSDHVPDGSRDVGRVGTSAFELDSHGVDSAGSGDRLQDGTSHHRLA